MKHYYIHPESSCAGVIDDAEELDPCMEIIGPVLAPYPTQKEFDELCLHEFGRTSGFSIGYTTIIAGSRDITNPWEVDKAIKSCPWTIKKVLSGGCRGVDTLGETWAAWHGIPFDVFPADWTRFGRMAGPKRNLDMAEHAEALIAIWNGLAGGTAHMINIAERRGLRVHIHHV